jgi:hypothetical protein
MKEKLFIPLLLLVLTVVSCEKWSDPKAVDDPRINERKYCNDPEAVNYNWNFPGQPDNTTCIYPSDLFEGNYTFTDSIYSADQIFDSVRTLITYPLQIIPVSKSAIRIIGFCGATDSLRLSAERSTYRADVDSTIQVTDTTFDYGQLFCRSLDTVSGSITKDRYDSTRLIIDFKVVSDTGVNYHRGTAIKL